jgi:TrmH family RNA methyltransferase
MRYDFLPTVVYHAPSELSERAGELVERFQSARVETVQVSARDLRAMTDATTPQGLFAVFDLPEREPDELLNSTYRKVIVCDGISDPGNLGTLIRSALAFGFDMMLLTEHTTDPYAPKVVRSSAGSVFGLSIIPTTVKKVVNLADKGDYVLVSAQRSGSTLNQELTSIIKSKRLLLAVGSEAHGLSLAIAQNSALHWRIEHNEDVESLNAAVAGSIMMKQVYDVTN